MCSSASKRLLVSEPDLDEILGWHELLAADALDVEAAAVQLGASSLSHRRDFLSRCLSPPEAAHDPDAPWRRGYFGAWESQDWTMCSMNRASKAGCRNSGSNIRAKG